MTKSDSLSKITESNDSDIYKYLQFDIQGRICIAVLGVALRKDGAFNFQISACELLCGMWGLIEKYKQ